MGVILRGGSVVGQRDPAPSCALTWGCVPSSRGFLGSVLPVLPRLMSTDTTSPAESRVVVAQPSEDFPRAGFRCVASPFHHRAQAPVQSKPCPPAPCRCRLTSPPPEGKCRTLEREL